MAKPPAYGIVDVLEDWDGHVVEFTLITGEKVSGPIGMFASRELVSMNYELPNETIYRVDMIVGVRYISEELEEPK